MSESVELLGGPSDGTRLAIRHGNVIRMARAQPTVVTRDDVPPQGLSIDEVIYERSARNPSRFIFRPSQRDGVDCG
ncbi:hypothetical protein [Sphingobium sp.]|uniref:hypothetical protein n=1 Tax=Sphingobium sp. TaxID=1912891 RepID=UPI003BB73210